MAQRVVGAVVDKGSGLGCGEQMVMGIRRGWDSPECWGGLC